MTANSRSDMNAENARSRGRPTLTWFPVRFIRDIVRGKRSVDSWLRQAPELGFSWVEIYHALVADREGLNTKLKELGLKVSMLTCAPDFTNPDAKVRKSQIEDMKSKVNTACYLGAPAVRVTTGMSYPETSIDEGINWASECLLELADYAEPKGVKLCLENHYKDRMWDRLDFAAKNEIFIRIYDRLRPTPVVVNFDTSQPMVMNTDELTLLEYVKEKVYNVHVGDRLRGQRPHVVIGEGEVDFDGIFSILKSVNYNRFFSVEDGSSEGDEGLRRGLSFLRAKASKYWGQAPG